jgi:hypothetical protein
MKYLFNKCAVATFCMLGLFGCALTPKFSVEFNNQSKVAIDKIAIACPDFKVDTANIVSGGQATLSYVLSPVPEKADLTWQAEGNTYKQSIDIKRHVPANLWGIDLLLRFDIDPIDRAQLRVFNSRLWPDRDVDITVNTDNKNPSK